MKTIVSTAEAVAAIGDGARVMIGGFMGCGSPHLVIEALVATGVRDLTVISNDAGLPDFGVGRLLRTKAIRTLIATHVGLNPEVATQMATGELELQLMPQGTFVEAIRAGGAGLGGVLTRTGLGTLVAEGKQIVSVDGQDFLLERPLRAEVALITGHTVDTNGNVWYKGTTRNFNNVMATAADFVIVEADHVVEIGTIPPEDVVTPGVLIDVIVDGERGER
ncbi:MAG: CoA transferase subunit A [Candidatus Phosphoribacter sp.]|nr:CoA transferase subunit A [Actinomycetales bacterium]